MANSATFARRQKERARKQQAEEKRAKRAERREQKKQGEGTGAPVDPMNDPTIDWANAVRQTSIPDEPEEETEGSED